MNRDQLLNLTLSDMSFKEVLALFRRRRAIFWGTLLVFLLGGAVLSAIMAPAYRSGSRILVEGRTQASPAGTADDVVAIITSTSGTEYDVLTQIQILESFDMLLRALRRADYPIPNRMTFEEFVKLPKVDVVQIQTTNVIQISVEFSNGEMALKVAQALPIVYQEYVLDRQRDQVRRTMEFIAARVSEEKESLRLAMQEQAAFRSENSILDARTESELRAGRVAEAQRRLNEAEADLRGAEAALVIAQRDHDALPKTIENRVTTANPEALDREEGRLNDLYAQREALLVTNLPDSDRVKRIDAAIEEAKKNVERVRNEVDRSVTQRNAQLDVYAERVSQTKAGVEAGKARVELARQEVDRREGELKALAPLNSRQEEMFANIEDTRFRIQRLETLQNDVRLRDNALQSPVTDITGAFPPEKVRPNWTVNLLLATVLGVLFGAIAAVARDTLQDKVNTAAEACLIAEREVLGRIPLRSSARDPLIADPQRARAFEAYRLLRSSLLIANQDHGAKAFLVSSSVPKEGKTVVAGNLAVALALEGKKVILIEGNLRNPAVHKLFKAPVEKGLGEVLTGKLTLAEALKDTETPGLQVLTAGSEVPNPTELVASPAMKSLVESAMESADLVLVDGPASFGLADAQSLVGAVRNVLYVVQVMAPNKTQMREAVAMIDFAGGKILGLIINKDNLAANRLRK